MISLENITIQILYGIVAATISFLALVRQVGIKPLSFHITSSLKLSAKPRRSRTPVGTGRTRTKARSKSGGRTAVHSSKNRKAPRSSVSRRRGGPMLHPVAVTSDPPMLVPVVQNAVPSCPTCGLEAPQELMMEHFRQALLMSWEHLSHSRR